MMSQMLTAFINVTSNRKKNIYSSSKIMAKVILFNNLNKKINN